MHADELHKHLHELNNIRMGRSTLRAGRIKFVYEQETSFPANTANAVLWIRR